MTSRTATIHAFPTKPQRLRQLRTEALLELLDRQEQERERALQELRDVTAPGSQFDYVGEPTTGRNP